MFKQIKIKLKIKLNLNQIRIAPWLWVFAALLLTNVAWAKSITKSITFKFNRGNIPSTAVELGVQTQFGRGVHIWTSETGTEIMQGMVCVNANECTTGLIDLYEINGGSTDINLPFTNRETGEQKTLTLVGTNTASGCINRQMNNVNWPCGGVRKQIAKFSIVISERVLKNLEPGEWKATLKTRLKNWNGGGTTQTKVGEWEINITIHVTDFADQQIYLSDGSTVALDLGLQSGITNINQLISPRGKNLDLCLYDGDNSGSTRIDMQFIGADSIPNQDLFSIYHESNGNKNDPRNRIDYKLTMTNPLQSGPEITLSNGLWIGWTALRSNGFRKKSVSINGKDVQCVPLTLTFTPEKFKITEKNPGNYQGTLRILYTPSTTTIRQGITILP